MRPWKKGVSRYTLGTDRNFKIFNKFPTSKILSKFPISKILNPDVEVGNVRIQFF